VSRAELYAWTSFAALAAVFWWFQMRMLDGWTIVDQPARELFEIYILTIALSAALEIIISLVLFGGAAVEKDERDRAIEARANLNERIFIIIAVNILIWQALWEGVLEGHALPKIDLANLPTLFFFLFAVLFAGEAVKRLSTIWLYRVQTPA